MAKSYLIKGGMVVTETGEQVADVLIVGDRILSVGQAETPTDAETIDATGRWVLPGFVDLHTHLREPGDEDAETIETGTRAAVVGGYAAVVAMPNTKPATDSVDKVESTRSRAKDSALCDVIISSAITNERAGDELVDIDALTKAGVSIFTDDGSGVQDGQLMREALESAVKNGVVIAQHCEDSCLSNGGAINRGATTSSYGISTQAPESEDVMVMRDIALARETGAKIHFLHISTAKSMAMVRAAKREGLNVTAEVTPHHLSLTSALVSEGNSNFRVNPPLREEADRVALINGLRDGTIDAIATDHAPHTAEKKQLPIEQAPPGMVGLETAFSVANTVLEPSASELAKLFSTNPARIAGVSEHHGAIATGRKANVTVVDPEAVWEVDPAVLVGKSKNSPFAGMKLRGRVTDTFVNGERMVANGKATR